MIDKLLPTYVKTSDMLLPISYRQMISYFAISDKSRLVKFYPIFVVAYHFLTLKYVSLFHHVGRRLITC